MLAEYPLAGFLTTTDGAKARVFFEGVLGLSFASEDERRVAFRWPTGRLPINKTDRVTPPVRPEAIRAQAPAGLAAPECFGARPSAPERGAPRGSRRRRILAAWTPSGGSGAPGSAASRIATCG